MGHMSTNELLSELDRAVKAVTDVDTFGDSLLQPQKFDEFVRRMEDRSVVMPEARFVEMEAQQTDIDRTGFVGRILHSGSTDTGDSRELSSSDFSEPTAATNKLIAQELQAITSLRDRALRRNIEKGGFEDTLVDLFAEAAGRDFEEYALLGDTNIAHADDDVLSKTDGWVKTSANKVYGGSGGQFDTSDSDWPETMFQAQLDALPKRFIQNISEWRIYVPFSVLDAYRDLLKARNTELGDRMMTEGGGPTMSNGSPVTATLPWKGLWVTYCPLLERSREATGDYASTEDNVAGRLALLSHPDNMAWGVFHEVSIEQEREAKARRTDFVLTFEGDAHYEDENGAVAAFIDKDDDVVS